MLRYYISYTSSKCVTGHDLVPRPGLACILTWLICLPEGVWSYRPLKMFINSLLGVEYFQFDIKIHEVLMKNCPFVTFFHLYSFVTFISMRRHLKLIMKLLIKHLSSIVKLYNMYICV